jgi:hypothetical protein
MALREGHAAGSDRQFQDIPVPGQFGEGVHGFKRFLQYRVSVRLVVPTGIQLAERLGSITLRCVKYNVFLPACL